VVPCLFGSARGLASSWNGLEETTFQSVQEVKASGKQLAVETAKREPGPGLNGQRSLAGPGDGRIASVVGRETKIFILLGGLETRLPMGTPHFLGFVTKPGEIYILQVARGRRANRA